MSPSRPGAEFARALGLDRDSCLALDLERRGALYHEKLPDLAWFLDEGLSFEERPGAALSRRTARALHDFIAPRTSGKSARSLPHRILIDPLLLSEHDRDQNVYLGPFYTRVLTRAVPDLIFQPCESREAALAMKWARESGVPVTLRGAGTTAMGGAVPGRAGLLLDLSRLDQIHVDVRDRVAHVGAGARLKQIHERLAAEGLALHNFPSNLGGTFAGWFATGGIGLGSYAGGDCVEHVRSAELILPHGTHLRLHDDGRLEILPGEPEQQPHHYSAPEATAWWLGQGLPELRLSDLAHTEGQFGILLSLSVSVEPAHETEAHLVPFATRDEALKFVGDLCAAAERAGARPRTLKFLSPEHAGSVHEVWAREGRVPRDWARSEGGWVYFDFPRGSAGGVLQGERIAPALRRGMPATAAALFADRFRPQQIKRLGPGLVASEVILPLAELRPFLAAADRISARTRVPFEYEIYYMSRGRALVIAGYLANPRRRGFMTELLISPVLTETAVSRHRGEAYVLGRWNAAFCSSKFDARQRSRLMTLKTRLDPQRLVNGTIFFEARMRFANLPGRVFMATFRPCLRLLGAVMGLGLFSRPAGVAEHAEPPVGPGEHAASCVNCGECNSVCPVYHESRLRLPQLLTHMGERLKTADYGDMEGTLLDLCMRCGNCAEVCQAGIPHLPLYQAMQATPAVSSAYRRERHELLLGWLRTSHTYLRRFLGVRPGHYLRRTPASLPGEVHFLLRRAENDSGPRDSCIHCGACVPVCPTGANFEFQGGDARLITTDEARCVGCGTCVEVCPANLANGGRTLRVMEAPAEDWMEAVREFARRSSVEVEKTGS